MTVDKLLSGKGSKRRLVTVAPEDTVANAVATLKREGIGAVVVRQETGRIAGILSERDVVRALAEGGADALSRPVSAVMTREVVTCERSDPVTAVMGRMHEGSFRHLPVTENGQVCDMVSMSDIVRYRLGEVEAEADHLRTYICQ